MLCSRILSTPFPKILATPLMRPEHLSPQMWMDSPHKREGHRSGENGVHTVVWIVVVLTKTLCWSIIIPPPRTTSRTPVLEYSVSLLMCVCTCNITTNLHEQHNNYGLTECCSAHIIGYTLEASRPTLSSQETCMHY